MSRFTRFSWVRLKIWEPCLCKTFDKFHIWLFLPVCHYKRMFWWPLTTMMTFLQIGGSHNPACIHFKFNPLIPGQVCKLQGHQQPLLPLSMLKSENNCHKKQLSQKTLSPLSISKSKNICHPKPKTIVTIVNANALFISIVPNTTILVSNYVVRVVLFTNAKSQHRSYKS